MAITAFSNFVIDVSDQGTMPYLNYLDNKTFVDIGSGNVLKVQWNTPVAQGNIVESYKITILALDTTSASYRSFYSANIGNVNTFYLKSSMLAAVNRSFCKLRIYVEAISRFGASYGVMSNILSVYVSKGAGNYIKVPNKAYLKRTLAFAKLAFIPLGAAQGILVADNSGKQIYAKRSSAQDSTTGWALMQECFTKDSTNNFCKSDLKYEVLTDINGDLITDSTSSTVYIL